MGVPQKLEQDQYSLSVSLISHVHLQIKLDSMRLQELLPKWHTYLHILGAEVLSGFSKTLQFVWRITLHEFEQGEEHPESGQ